MSDLARKEDERSIENLRGAYTFAREERAQADTMLWEVAAIIWGGQTLLLGFVLEAISGSKSALALVVVVAIIGIVMAVFTKGVTAKRAAVCRKMIEIMRQVEDQLEMPVKPQHEIDSTYGGESRFQTKWSDRLNYSFVVAWIVVILVALVKLWVILCHV